MAQAYLGVLVNSITEDAADISLLLEQVCLNFHAWEELVRFQEILQSHEAGWAASDDGDIQNHFEYDRRPGKKT